MPIRPGATIIAATLLLWPLSSLRAGESVGATTAIVPIGSSASTKFADLYRQAPIGHRQPRPSELSAPVQALSADVELRRLDVEIDRKLIICRGC
ncbi:hypothetical protein [Bradyrhizobium sp. OK095]|uniref:hypothetical protein n=1 Tax=Bradyrhizobium sp. OK095 TaxID=1882760 RepID=UPI0008D494E0|nr:hypothetical protein [Bradyrhizobium sp. OK095]SEN46467.1 hypothetical protein SAMN05443254_108331 [Bradyrhizobium sp. OK095]